MIYWIFICRNHSLLDTNVRFMANECIDFSKTKVSSTKPLESRLGWWSNLLTLIRAVAAWNIRNAPLKFGLVTSAFALFSVDKTEDLKSIFCTVWFVAVASLIFNLLIFNRLTTKVLSVWKNDCQDKIKWSKMKTGQEFTKRKCLCFLSLQFNSSYHNCIWHVYNKVVT